MMVEPTLERRPVCLCPELAHVLVGQAEAHLVFAGFSNEILEGVGHEPVRFIAMDVKLFAALFRDLTTAQRIQVKQGEDEASQDTADHRPDVGKVDQQDQTLIHDLFEIKKAIGL